MTREAALLVMVAVALVLLGLAAWGWVRRARRDRIPLIQPAELDEAATPRETIDALYVATTVHDAPLERIAAPGLGYRSPVTITVTDAAVALDLTNQPRITITADRITAVTQATLTIDRVVEKDGLVRLSWLADTGVVVDTYLRPREKSARHLADALAPLAPAPDPSTATGDPE
jgi:hypothetical protein